jgi:malate synthase
VTYELFKTLLGEELEKIRAKVGEDQFRAGNFERAAKLMDQITAQDDFAPFLTSVAYQEID